MKKVFTKNSPYKKQARSLAILWTLLIFIACFMPAHDLPKVNIPIIDKWVHLVLFGGFSFLWLCAYPTRSPGFLFVIFFSSICLGSVIEMLQGLLTFLGRDYELMDIVADTIGGSMGILLFSVLSYLAEKSTDTAN